jgi:peroxiredoxin
VPKTVRHVSSSSTRSDYVRYAPSTILKAGTPAPDFMLHSTPDQKVSITEFRDHPVILAFYPADWSPVCGDEMTLFNEILPEFEKFDAKIMGISVDGVWCHLAISKDRKLQFPLLSDFEPFQNVLCLWLIKMGLFVGAMCLRLVLILVHRVFLKL